MRSFRQLALVAALLLQSLPALADDVITNVMSPVVSYQFQNSLSEPGTAIISPIVSFQYFDWPGDDVLQLNTSPRVSYFYNVGAAGPSVALQGRVTAAAGTPLAGAVVSASVVQTVQGTTQTAMDGSYSLPSLPPGVYALKASFANHATSVRALTLSPATVHQDFQLTPLPPAPTTTHVNREPTVTYTTGPLGSMLKIFDGTTFVPINVGNAPQPNRMTIVMTHGWASDPDVWSANMAAEMWAENVTASAANIVCWDWHEAARGPLPVAHGHTVSQGVALGTNLLWRLGPTYSQPIHFIGHSLGALVNAAAANYLHGDRTGTGRQECSATRWLPSNTHLTLLDAAEAAAVSDASWNSAMPIQWKWVDNYFSQWGLYQPDAINADLYKPATLTAVDAHSYAWYWYDLTITNPANCTLGFQRSYEARRANLSVFDFPPSSTILPPGVLYYQTIHAVDPLELQVAPFQTLNRTLETAGGLGVRSVVGLEQGYVQYSNGLETYVLDPVVDGEEIVGGWLYNGYEYVANVTEQGKQAVVHLFDSAMFRFGLRTPPPSPIPTPGEPPMMWLPIAFPANATAMAFDFTVEGDPVDDVLVCGIGTNNLFSLEAKYIPTNRVSASPLINVSAWAGTTNELFFGFLGGTSTNATLVIENIRFYSLAQPTLEISVSGNATVLSWPLSAGGYEVETTPTLTTPTWEAVTNAAAIAADRYVLTNSLSEQSRFFRLRPR